MSRREFLAPGQSSTPVTEVERLSSDVERETWVSSDGGLTNFCPDPSSETPGNGTRKRASSPSLASGSSQASKKTKTSESLTQTSDFCHGFIAGGCPKIPDYIEIVKALLLRTMREYESLISAIDTFPDGLTQGDWARACWKNTAKNTKKRFELTSRMEGLIKKRGSRIRGHVLNQVRSQIVATYGFSRQTSMTTLAKNCLLSAQLAEGAAFHYKDPSKPSGYAQNKIISEVIHLAWFEDATAPGVMFPDLVNPISFNTMALIFTLIKFCIKEWSTGKYVAVQFSEKTCIDSYRVNQADLATWGNINSLVVENMWKKLYNRARRNAGVLDDSKPITHLIGAVEDRVRNELEG
ncbi:hypothetical protein BYT27DRAFT_7088601 [Phlegmacium glaucopus]|nr:hypothetical protein BYT27DRAFT_7088601 [Phlegmacium glaucopus]